MSDFNESTKELLELNLDEVVEEGRVTSKKKKKTIVIVAIIICILCTVLLFISHAKSQRAYDAAIILADHEFYRLASKEFDELGNFKDSKQLAEYTKIAQNYTTSTTYLTLKSVIASMNLTGFNESLRYDWRERTLIEESQITSLNSSDFSNPSQTQILMWNHLFDNADNATKTYYDSNQEGKFDIDARFNLTTNDGIVLYSSLNGKMESCYFDDIEALKQEAFEKIQQEASEYIEKKDFAAVIDLIDSVYPVGKVEDGNKKIEDCYLYAKAMDIYYSKGENYFYDALKLLRDVSDDFEDTAEYKNKFQKMLDEIKGKYEYKTKNGTHKLTIDDNSFSIFHDEGLSYVYGEDYSTFSAEDYAIKYANLGYEYQEPKFNVENDKIKSVKIIVGGLYGFSAFKATITFGKDEATIKCSDPGSEYTYEKRDAQDVSGYYKKK